MLLRSEAASSSQIENLTASARAIFSAELGVKRSRNAEEIAANTQAMRAALDLARDLSVESVRRMHAVLMAQQPRHTPGVWRTEPVWIGTRADTPVGASYVAPSHDHIPDLMDDLTRFVNDLAVSPLVAVAVPVSAGLLADVEGYHAALTAYRAGDVDPIIHMFASASLRAVHNARTLVDAGIASSKAEHRLGPFWRSDEVLAAIDAFVERSGRRSAGHDAPR